MKQFTLKLFSIFLISLMAFVVQASTIPLSEVKTRDLTSQQQAWFMKEFPRSYMSVYDSKTFLITKDDKAIVLGPENSKDKETWLIDAAKDEFENYVLKPKPGYKALLVEYQGKPIGSILYRLLDNNNTIYVAQYFIVPEFQKHGIGKHLLVTTLSSMYPDAKRYEVLARHQNDAAFLVYQSAGFSFGDIAIVKKYDYDPLRYMSFFKDIH